MADVAQGDYDFPNSNPVPARKKIPSPLVLSTTTPITSASAESEYSSPKTPRDGLALKYTNSFKKSGELEGQDRYIGKNTSGADELYTRPSKGSETHLADTPTLDNNNSFDSSLVSSIMDNSDLPLCSRCDEPLEVDAKTVNSDGKMFHPKCFVCAQCFRPFPDGVFYEFEGRKYCEHDFHVLYAPCCGKCSEFIVGRVIRAMSATWHPHCFTCELCMKELADQGFVRVHGRAMCKECKVKVIAESSGKHLCQKCHFAIDEEPLRFRGDVFHAYHFRCTGCDEELTSTAREVKDELFCLRCHDKMGIPICGACRRPIEERVVTALGKNWHVDHFSCAKCEKPFLGGRYFEKAGLAYCETHFLQLFGSVCYVCDKVIKGDVVNALNKSWCSHHFACSSCDRMLKEKSKFYEVDLKPVCKKCYDRFPRELRLRLKQYHEMESAKGSGVQVN